MQDSESLSLYWAMRVCGKDKQEVYSLGTTKSGINI